MGAAQHGRRGVLRADGGPTSERLPAVRIFVGSALRGARLRTADTLARRSERLLWQSLRGSKLGTSFKRQVPLGGRSTVDFLASSAKLVVEVDGGYHARRVAADASRDRALSRLGYRVLRLDAELVVRDMPGALARIRAALAEAR